MTRTRLSAVFLTVCFTGLVFGELPEVGVISVRQIPERITWHGTNVSITCHITVDPRVKRVMVRWLIDNETVVDSTAIDIPDYASHVPINTTLNLLSVRLNHSGMYYCTAQMDLPTVETAKHGNGTFVCVAFLTPSSTTVTPVLTSVTVEGPLNLFTNTVMCTLISALVCVFLIVCIACLLHKGRSRIEAGAEDALVDATHGSPFTADATHEDVVYSALNMDRYSVKSRNENCAVLGLTSETGTEESVTYSEVHLKKKSKDEG